MKSSKTSFLRNCISGWNVRSHDSLREDCPNSDIIVIFARDLCEPCSRLRGQGLRTPMYDD